MNTEQKIEPITLGKGRGGQQANAPRQPRGKQIGILLLFLVLVALTAFMFTARRVEVQLNPGADKQTLVGTLPVIPIPDGFFALPGRYTLLAEKEGYFDLEAEVQVTRSPRDQVFAQDFAEKPGTLSISSKPEEGVTVTWQEVEQGSTPLQLEAPSGEGTLTLQVKDYLPWTSNVVVLGKGQEQALHVELTPAWAAIDWQTQPPGATLEIDGTVVGQTPLQTELFQGSYWAEFSREGFENHRMQIEVVADTPQAVGPVRLQPAFAQVHIVSNPTGAYIQVNGQYNGQTPKTVRLQPDRQHEVLLLKTGYKKIGQLFEPRPGDKEDWSVELEPEAARILVKSFPAGADVMIDGETRGVTPIELVVPALEQAVLVRKDGYAPEERTIRPKMGPVSRVTFKLKRLVEGSATIAANPSVTAPNGAVLNLIPMGSFDMGSSRREQGRRSNETKIKVEFTRPFYMGLHEVTNKEFLEFNPKHNSGFFKSKKLGGPEQPVVNVRWQQAAQYCNWLSEREGLDPVYWRDDDKWISRKPVPNGYRLPTEAEWEFCARYFNGKAESKYSWGPTWPPSYGNFADLTAQYTLEGYMKDFKDGYAVTAPIGKSKPNALGLFDFDGNAAEWCHDLYIIYTATQVGQTFKDPTGAESGLHHVVRGPSWMHYRITHLRNAYRGYEDESKPDIGFRIARYVE